MCGVRALLTAGPRQNFLVAFLKSRSQVRSLRRRRKEDPAGEVNRDKRILTGKKRFWVILSLVVIVIVWNKRHNLLYPLGAGLNGAFVSPVGLRPPYVTLPRRSGCLAWVTSAG